jgi:radical SAM-linked protein
MQKFRLVMSKGDEVRFISHLDTAKVIERAIRRARLPVALSQGFNPHYKISYGSVLALGHTSECEVVDIEMSEPLQAETVKERLTAQLPTGFKLKEVEELPANAKPAMGVMNRVLYEVILPLEGKRVEREAFQRLINDFRKQKNILVMRKRKNRMREIIVNDFVADFFIKAFTDTHAYLSLTIKMLQEGSIKPEEVMKAFYDFAHFSWDLSELRYKRVKLWYEE